LTAQGLLHSCARTRRADPSTVQSLIRDDLRIAGEPRAGKLVRWTPK